MTVLPATISAAMIATLSTTCPGLSCELGTPERKILDVVATAISQAYVQNYLTGSLLDISTKSGLELEQFVGIFGFGRLQGQAAVGVVTVEMTTASTTNFDMPIGTQFYTQTGVSGVATPLYYASTQDVVLVAGSFSADVPVQCTAVGIAGNIPPDSITYLGTVIGSSSVTNLQAMTGGVDVESDGELRQRFQDTLLRNISGTSDWYMALCLQNTNVSRVAVYGPTSLYTTQIVVPSSTPLTVPVVEDVKYVWPLMESVFEDLGQPTEVFFTSGDDYVLSSGDGAPTFTWVDTGALVTGDIADLQFQYTTRCSRNDPVNGITNKVDVFVDGIDPFTVTEQTVVAATTFSTSSTAPLYTGNFTRLGDPGAPSSTNRFMRLGSVPLVSFPSTITVGADVYTQGTQYNVVVDTTLLAGSQFETSGIEWLSSGPTTGTEMTLNYVYNKTPEILTAVVNTAKQICTDVMIHQASYQYITPCLDIQYSLSYDIGSVNSAITTRLQTYFQTLGYGAWIYVSTLCLAVQQVLGVVNVNLTTSGESSTYGIQVFENSADVDPTTVWTSDFKLADNQLAEFLTVNILRKATP